MASLIILTYHRSSTASATYDDSQTITLHLPPLDYTIDSEGVHATDLGNNTELAAPMLPVWNTVVELPLTGEWNISYSSTEKQQVEHRLSTKLPSVPVPELTKGDFVEWSLENIPVDVPTKEQPDPEIYETDAFYPSSLIMSTDEQWQRGKRLLAIRVFPFQYNPVQGLLRVHPDLTVTVQVNDIHQTTSSYRGPQSTISLGIQNPASSGKGIDGAVRIYTTERGVHRLTYSELADASIPVDSINPISFAMTYLGESIDIQVTGEDDGSFDPEDSIIFYAIPYTERYMTTNVYWLTYGGGAGSRINTKSEPLNTELPPENTIRQTTHVEANVQYVSTFDQPTNSDYWFDSPLQPNNSNPPSSSIKSVAYNIETDDSLTEGMANLHVAVHGTFENPPDHAVRLSLNGTEYGPYTWTGMVEHQITETIPANLLTGTNDELSIIADMDDLPPNQFSEVVYPNWAKITYPAAADADGEEQIHIEQMEEGAKRIRVTGFNAGTGEIVRVYDTRDHKHPIELTTTLVQNMGGSDQLDFWDEELPNPSYFLSTENAMHSAVAIELDTPSNWQSPEHLVDYIAIVPASLWEAPEGLLGIDDLLAHREQEGLRVAKVDVQDIYDEFNAGRVDPEAIRHFLTYAYYNWNAGESTPPKYVVLVGDGHYDFKGYQGTPMLNLIPPYLLYIDPWLGETAADNRFVSVDGPNDYLPDMHIGRLSGQIKWDEENQAYLDPTTDIDASISKIINYETLEPNDPWQQKLVFVADNWNDQAGNLHLLTDAVRELVPPSYQDEGIYYNSGPDLDTGGEMRAAIKDAFNNDALFIQWLGHGSAYRWGSVSMFNIFDPEIGSGDTDPLEANTEWPMTFTYACLSDYYIANVNVGNLNHWQSLGESLTRAPERGSLVDFGPTGLHIADSAVLLNKGVIEALLQQRMERAGEAADAGRLYFWANSGAWYDVIDTNVLLGDPATRLHLPPTPLDDSYMSASDETPIAGQQVIFNVNIVNGGTEPLSDTMVVIDYPEDQMTINAAPSAVDDGDTITWDDLTLPVGTTVRTFLATLNGDLATGTVVEASGYVRARMENISVSTSLVIEPQPTTTPLPTDTPTPTNTPTSTNTPTPTATVDPSITPSVTPTASNTPTPSNTSPGDVSCDGTSNAVDALFMLQYVVGTREATDTCPLPAPPPETLYEPSCDVSDDNACNTIDALFVLQCVVGIPNSFCPDGNLVPSSSQAN